MKEIARTPSVAPPSNGPRDLIGRLLSKGAGAWDIPEGRLVAMWLVPVAVVAGAVASALMGKQMYKLYTGEDAVAETLQVVFYALALAGCLRIIPSLLRKNLGPVACLYLLVAAGLVFMIGEELSWGQRIFGWQTTEALRAINKQQELNLHNIRGVGYAFKWLQLLVGAYGTIPPLLASRPALSPRQRSFLALVVPHYTLIPFFLPLFVWRIYRNLFEVPPRFYFVVSEFNEVMELVLAIGMALFMLFQLRRLKDPAHAPPS